MKLANVTSQGFWFSPGSWLLKLYQLIADPWTLLNSGISGLGLGTLIGTLFHFTMQPRLRSTVLYTGFCFPSLVPWVSHPGAWRFAKGQKGEAVWEAVISMNIPVEVSAGEYSGNIGFEIRQVQISDQWSWLRNIIFLSIDFLNCKTGIIKLPPYWGCCADNKRRWCI